MLLEISKMEQRYEAVLGVVRDGRTVQEVADAFGATRQSVHNWLRRYEQGGMPALDDAGCTAMPVAERSPRQPSGRSSGRHSAQYHLSFASPAPAGAGSTPTTGESPPLAAGHGPWDEWHG